MANEDEKQPDRELLNIEYQEAVSHSRFIVGIRFNYFVSFTIFFFTLVGAFHYVWTSETKKLEQLKIGPFLYAWTTQQDVFGKLKPWLMLAIAGFGFYTVIVAMIIERRSIQLYRAGDQRAADLERLMGIRSGIRQIFTMPWRTQRFFRIPVTHSMGIAMFYRAVALIWIVLALFSVYKILV